MGWAFAKMKGTYSLTTWHTRGDLSACFKQLQDTEFWYVGLKVDFGVFQLGSSVQGSTLKFQSFFLISSPILRRASTAYIIIHQTHQLFFHLFCLKKCSIYTWLYLRSKAMFFLPKTKIKNVMKFPYNLTSIYFLKNVFWHVLEGLLKLGNLNSTEIMVA